MKRKLSLRGMFTSILVLLSISFLGGGFLPSQAIATNDLFWTDYDVIGHSNINGSSVIHSYLSANNAYGVAVGSEYVYWVNNGINTIGRSDLSAANVNSNFIIGCNSPTAIATDSMYIYWINYSTNTVGRASLDGSNVNQSFISLAEYYDRYGLAVDANYIYWSSYNYGIVGRANLDGSNVNEEFITGCTYPWGLAVDAGHVYWSNNDRNTIGRANLDGSSVNQNFITSTDGYYLGGLAVDTGYVYWVDQNYGRISRANLDGSNIITDFISNIDYGYGLAVSKVNFSIQSFKADPVVGVPPLNVTFTCDAVANGGSVAWYYWDFDNDGISDEKTSVNTTQHTYSTTGKSYAKVTVVDNLGDLLSSKAGSVTVANGPDLTGKFSELHWYDASNRINFKFQVKNVGNQDAGAFYINFYLNETGQATKPFFKRVKIAGLAAGASTTTDVDYIPTDTSIYGKYIVVTTDSYGNVADISRINNGTKAVIVIPKPAWP